MTTAHRRHFGLQGDPFHGFPDGGQAPTLPDSHGAVAREIAGSIREHRGLTALIGAEDVGKSTLLNAVARELPESIDVHVLKPGRPSPQGFYRSVFEELGIWESPESVEGCVRRLQAHVLETSGRGRYTVLVLDHAHDLPSSALVELEKLTSLEPWLQLLLVGTEELVERLLEPELGDLHERFAVACVLERLPEEELSKLLADRLTACGGSPELFEPEAMTALHRTSGGLPGRALQIADAALRVAYGRGLDRVDAGCVDRAVEDGPGGHRRRSRRPRDGRGADRVPNSDDGGRESPISIGARRPRPSRPEASGRGARIGAMALAEKTPARSPDSAGAASPERGDPARPWWASTSAPGSSTGAADSRGSLASTGGRPAGAVSRSTDGGRGDRRYGAAERLPEPLPRSLLPVLDDPHGLAAEQFRVLRLKLESWIDRRGGGPCSVLMTSAGPGEGKSMVTANLALLMATAHPGRILLVDGDLRRPRINTVFDIPQRPGFADLLAARCELDDSVHYLSRHSLSIVPSGRPGNPRDLMSPDRIEPVVGEMLDRFDVVLIDGTPLQPMVDARSLAGSVDGVLLAVRAGRTRYPALSKALRTVDRDRRLGVVMTCVEEDVAQRYGGYRS